MKIYAKEGVLTKARLIKGLSQRELASQIGLSHAYVSLLERSVKSLGPATAKRISEALDKDFEQLFFIV